jgi:tetratricopeptide (TPR) repeat protein
MSDRIATLLSWVEESPDDAFSRYALAMEYKKHNQFEKAAEQFGELVTRKPSYCATYYHYGLLLHQLHRTDDAIGVLEKGLAETTKAGEQHANEELQDAMNQVKEA